ncbi:MAG: hypothetical protein FJ294_10250 [Planctomycetes bacterium]|nr:hypothetical protein [Planctomycetota bacterium]
MVAALLAAALVAPVAQGPFEPGLRWREPAPAAAPWLPGALAFVAHGEGLFAVASGVAPRASLHSTAPFLGALSLPPSRALALDGASGPIAAAAGDQSHELFVLVQTALCSPSSKRTELVRLEPGAGGALVERWRTQVGGIGNTSGRLALARDGSRVALVLQDANTQQLLCEWRSALDGSVSAARVESAGPLRACEATASLSKLACVAGNVLRVLRDDATLEHVETLAGSTTALALDAQGSLLAVGAPASVRVLRSNASLWVSSAEFQGLSGEQPVRAALDDSGATLALGWWHAASGRGARFEAWKLHDGVRSFSRSFVNPVGGPQDFPEALALARDGSRLGCGRWGGDAVAQAWLFDLASGNELLSATLPGSVRSLALDASGTRLAVGCKSTHAGSFSNAGEVRLYDTGERALQCLEEPLAGALLSVERRAPLASRVLFFFGPLRAQPVVQLSVPWWIERSAANVEIRAVDPDGVARLELAIPAAARGMSLGVQCVERCPGSPSRVTSEVLHIEVF